jgi:hypothetical protein
MNGAFCISEKLKTSPRITLITPILMAPKTILDVET